MRTAILTLLGTIVPLLLLSGCADSGSKEDTKTFTYAMSGMYRPFNFKKGGELVGFDVDIGRELARRMGTEPDPVTNPWQTIIQGLKAKKYDAILGSMAITDERLEQVDFSRPYYRSGAQIFVQAGNGAVQTAEDLEGKRIGVVKASTFRDVALELTDESSVVGYDSDVIALQDLTTGRIDAVITDKVVGLAAIKNNDLPIRPVGEPLFVDRMGIAVRKSDDALLQRINRALEDVIEDGTYERISKKWFGRDILGEE